MSRQPANIALPVAPMTLHDLVNIGLRLASLSFGDPGLCCSFACMVVVLLAGFRLVMAEGL